MTLLVDYIIVIPSPVIRAINRLFRVDKLTHACRETVYSGAEVSKQLPSVDT